jgi:hypothetical protein
MIDKLKPCRCFISLLLCAVVLFSVPDFKREVRADAIAAQDVYVYAEAAGVTLVVAPEAVALTVGMLVAGGIVVYTAEQGYQFTSSYLGYLIASCSTEEEIAEVLSQYGYSYHGGYITVDNDDTYAYVLSTGYDAYGVPTVGYKKVRTAQGYKDMVTSAGDTVKSGLKVASSVLTANGALMYEWLHSSDSGFELSTPMVSTTGSFDYIRNYFYTLMQVNAQSYFNYSFDTDTYSLDSYSIPASSVKYPLATMPYCDIYFKYLPSDDYYKAADAIFCIAVLYDDSGQYYSYYYGILSYSSNGTISHRTTYLMESGSSLDSTFYDVKRVFYKYSALCESVSEFTQVAHLVNTDAYSSTDTDDIYDTAVSGGKTITNGDIDLGLVDGTDVADTLWGTPTAILDTAIDAGAVNDDGEVVVALPGVVSGTTDLDISTTYPTVLNPDITETADTVVSDGTITGIVQSILNFVKSIPDILRSILDFLKSIPTLIINGIKSIFVPSDGFIEDAIDEIKTSFNEKFGGGNWMVSDAFGAEKAMDNQNVTMNFGGYEFTFTIIDWSYAKNAIDDFRPYIRGFLALLLCLYSTNQFLGLIGQPTLSTLGSAVPSDKGKGKKG